MEKCIEKVWMVSLTTQLSIISIDKTGAPACLTSNIGVAARRALRATLGLVTTRTDRREIQTTDLASRIKRSAAESQVWHFNRKKETNRASALSFVGQSINLPINLAGRIEEN